MTFSLRQGGVVMSSQITHTHTIINIHPLAHMLHIHVTASNHSPGDNHTSTGGRSERTQGKQKWPSETHSVTDVPGLSTLSDLSRIDGQPPPSFLCCPKPPSHHPSSLTSVSLVPALHLLPPSTPFWPNDTHPFIPHAKTISILSYLLHSLTPFLFQL